MAHTVIGTAGHIDHGKTLLVKGLTGVDTDRTPEEKARGITIELGFAVFGEEATIIDVPGHERFVKTMVAGVSTIDVALLVIAADDGVMPQSREHLDVLELLGVARGVIALNKADLADDDWLDLVEEDIRELVAGTFLEEAPIVRVSAVSLQGMDELKQHLQQTIEHTEEKRSEGPFRLSVDRAFSAKGFGLVCTGTVLSGRLTKGDPIEVLPAGKEVRTRSLQRHGEDVNTVSAGDRAAVNVVGQERLPIQRGDVLAEPGSLAPSSMLDARLRLVSSCPKELEHRTRVRLHLGTREVMARVVLLGHDHLQPGENGLVQLRLETPVAAAWGDRFVIRRYSPPLTIGGGVILEAHPAKHRRTERGLVERLMAIESGDGAEVVEAKLSGASSGCSSLLKLGSDMGLTQEQVQHLAEELVGDGRALRVTVDQQDSLVHAGRWSGIVARTEEILAQFHVQTPLAKGLNREDLRRQLGRYVPLSLFQRVLESLLADGRVAIDGSLVRASGHRIQFSGEEEQLKQQIEAALKQATLDQVPDVKELAQQVGVDAARVEAILRALEGIGEVVFLEGTLVLHASTMDEVRGRLRQHLETHAEITVSTFRDLIGSNRRYAMALLNRFDGDGFTQRNGDVRVLR
jgi:selenocysteine-specific elongation factor